IIQISKFLGYIGHCLTNVFKTVAVVIGVYLLHNFFIAFSLLGSLSSACHELIHGFVHVIGAAYCRNANSNDRRTCRKHSGTNRFRRPACYIFQGFSMALSRLFSFVMRLFVALFLFLILLPMMFCNIFFYFLLYIG